MRSRSPNSKVKIILMALIVSQLGGPLSAVAQTAQEKGLTIAEEADRRDTGYGDFTSIMLMTLKDKNGKERTRKIRMKTLEIEGEGDKNLIVFDLPNDIKGTAFLNYTHRIGDDDQWLYLPSLKRVKRISARNKSSSFMGSEFTYEDMASQEIEKHTYKLIRDEICENLDCFVVEFYPVDRENSGYSRKLVWIDKGEYRIWKVAFFDKKNELLKTLTYSGYNLYLGKYWRADIMNMVNHQTGKSTRLDFSNYQFNVGLDENDFTTRALQRAG